jgi:hypothetical protein
MIQPIPSPKDIAQRIPSRTRTRGGQLAFDFNDLTEPITAAVVEQMIVGATNKVYGKLEKGTDVSQDEDTLGELRELIVLDTIMQIELGFFSEQISTNRSPYRELKKEYDDELTNLLDRLYPGRDTGTASGGYVPPAPSTAANYAFPPTSIGDGILP